MKRMELNNKNSKLEVYHKNKVRNTNYKVTKSPTDKSINVNNGGNKRSK
jgi:hypothetical protein